MCRALTAVSARGSRGVHARTVVEILEHSQISVTMNCGDNYADALPRSRKSVGIGHVGVVPQPCVVFEMKDLLLHWHRLDCQGEFVHVEIVRVGESQVGGDLVSCLQHYHIFGNQLGGAETLALAAADDRGLSSHGLRQGLYGLELLDEPHYGVDEYHCEDHDAVDHSSNTAVTAPATMRMMIRLWVDCKKSRQSGPVPLRLVMTLDP